MSPALVSLQVKKYIDWLCESLSILHLSFTPPPVWVIRSNSSASFASLLLVLLPRPGASSSPPPPENFQRVGAEFTHDGASVKCAPHTPTLERLWQPDLPLLRAWGRYLCVRVGRLRDARIQIRLHDGLLGMRETEG